VAIDTETMGLNPHRDRLCVVQMSNGDGSADVIQIPKGHTDAPNLKALLANPCHHEDLSLRAASISPRSTTPLA
jgi:ribonuclease D